MDVLLTMNEAADRLAEAARRALHEAECDGWIGLSQLSSIAKALDAYDAEKARSGRGDVSTDHSIRYGRSGYACDQE